MSTPLPKTDGQTSPTGNPSSSPPAPRPPRRSKTRLVSVVTAVTIAGLVVVALLLSGTHSVAPNRGAGGTPALPEPSSSALAAAEPVVDRVPGGPWTLATLWGVDLTGGLANSTAGSVGGPSLPLNCKASRESASNIPPYSGNYSSGSLVSWFFYFVNSSATSVVAVEVTNGYANVTYEFSGEYVGACFVLPPDPLPPTYVNSTVAAEAVWGSANVTAFVHAHGSSNAEFVLARSYAAPGAGLAWDVSFSDCGFSWPQLAVAGADSAATLVNATTGALESSTSSVNC